MSFVQTLQTAFFSEDNTLRAQAEASLVEIRNTNPSQFFLDCTHILSQEDQNTEFVRQACGTLIKSNCRIQQTPQSEYLWLKLPYELREQLKLQLFEALISKSDIVRKAGADSISSIFTVEATQNLWPDLLDKLNNTTRSDVIEYRKSAIQTLGFICEKIKLCKDIKPFDEPTMEQVLTAICISCDSNQAQNIQEIRIIALKALRDSIEFLNPIFQKENVYTYVYRLLLQLIKTDSDRECLLHNFQVWGELAKYTYQQIQVIITELFPFVMNFINAGSSDQELASGAIEMWTSLLEECIAQNGQKYFNPDQEQVLGQSLCQNLLVMPTEEEELESQVQEASIRCLSLLTETSPDNTAQTYKVFISLTVQDPKWHYRQAAAMSMEALVESNTNKSLISQGFRTFFTLLASETNFKVKESTAKFLCKVSEKHPDIFFDQPSFLQDLSILCNLALTEKPQICYQICWAITQFTQSEYQKRQDCVLHQEAKKVCQQLLNVAFRADLGKVNSSIMDLAFMANMNLVQYQNSTECAHEFFRPTLQQFRSSFQVDASIRENLQTDLLSFLHIILLKLGDTQDDESIKLTFQLIFGFFEKIQDVTSDGIYILAALATCIKSRYLKYMQQVWPFVVHSLQKNDNPELLKACFGCISDIARALGDEFADYVKILDRILDGLNAPIFDRDIKLHMFMCVGDIFLSARTLCVPYLDKVFNIIDLGFSAVVQLSETQEAESQEYADDLKDHLVEMYTCMLHALNEVQHSQFQQIAIHFPKMFEYLKITCNSKYKPRLSYLRSAASLIADTVCYYEKQLPAFVQNDFFQYLINNIKNYGTDPQYKALISYCEKVYFYYLYIKVKDKFTQIH